MAKTAKIVDTTYIRPCSQLYVQNIGQDFLETLYINNMILT